MQWKWVVVAAVLACGCKKSEPPKTETQKKLEKIRYDGYKKLSDPEIVAITCDLAKELATNEEVRSTLEVQFYDRVKLDKDPGDIKCVVDAYSAWYIATDQQSLNPVAITRAWEHHKIASAKAVYDKMSPNVIAEAKGETPDARPADQPLTVADISKALGDLQTSLKGYIDEKDAPMDQRTPQDIPLYNVTVEKVAAIGPSAVPQLVDIWLTELQPIKIRAAAQALGRIDKATLLKETVKALDAYDAAYIKDPASRTTGSASAAAAGVHAALNYRGTLGVNVLFRALSSPDPAASGAAAKWLQANLDAPKAIDALFAYMAAKNEYSSREIKVYVDVITTFRADASPIVVKNLEALLAAAKSPKNVFWAHKLVALTALQQIGTKDAAPTVQKFVSDPTSFQSTPITNDPSPLAGIKDRKTITIKSLAEKTLAEVEKR